MGVVSLYPSDLPAEKEKMSRTGSRFGPHEVGWVGDWSLVQFAGQNGRVAAEKSSELHVESGVTDRVT